LVVRRKKKSRYMRGYRNQGYGSIGQHRKSGSRGGRGAAGFHKHMWSWVVKYYPDWFGKHGFRRPLSVVQEVREINVGELNELVKALKSEGKIRRVEGTYSIDLTELGFNKLLGRGRISEKVKVRVYEASETAIAKVKEAGGEVIILRETKEG